MSARKPRSKKIDADVLLISDILSAQTQALDRGGLTWLAGKLGLSVSAMRKRTLTPGCGLDAPSIRAVLLILATKADRFTADPIKTVKTADYTIEIHETGAGIVPTWKQTK